VCVRERERDHGGTRAVHNKNEAGTGKVSSMTDKKANFLGRFKRKVDKQIIFREVTSLHHIPSHFVKKL